MGDLYKMFKSGKLLKQGSGGGGTSDYENLENLPSMNGHVIKGAMVSSDLDLPSIEDVESKADASETEQALQDKADKSTTYTKTEIDTALSNKADKSTTYTKTEVDTALGVKANSADVYSKTVVDTLLGNKADKSTTYTKTEVDTALGNKADKSTTYTKTEVDTALGGKQAKLTIEQLAAANSGITAERLTKDESNIAWNTNNGVKNFAPVSFIEKTASSEGFTVKTNCRLPAGDYILSFDYTSTSSATPAFFDSNNSIEKQLTAINGSGHKSLPFTVTSQDDIAGYYFYTMTAAKFENIMIRPAFISDDTFEPYSLPNTKITPELIELVDSGAKNLSPVSTGTSSGASYIVESAANLPAGDYVFCWKNSVTSGVSTVINCYKSDNTRVVNENEANSAVETRFITIPQDCVKFNLYTTGANQVTDLMICSKAAWGVSQKFVPYRPTYEETVEQVATNKNNISSVMPTYIEVSSTDTVDNLPQGVIMCAPTVSIAGIASGSWLVIHTYYLLSNGLRRLQVLEAQTGERKSRYYGITAVGQDPSWGAWS